MQGTLEVWDGKIRRVDQKMDRLQELGSFMETQSDKQKKYFDDFEIKMKDMFEIPGLMGQENDKYSNIGDFVK